MTTLNTWLGAQKANIYPFWILQVTHLIELREDGSYETKVVSSQHMSQGDANISIQAALCNENQPVTSLHLSVAYVPRDRTAPSVAPKEIA